MSKSLLSGPKFNQTHQTYLDGAVKLIEILKNDDSVKKIMLGVIEPTSPGNRHCKVRSVEGNLVTIVFRDVSAIQVIRVVSKEKSIIKKIEEYANTVNPKRKSKREKKPKKTSVSKSLNRTSTHPLKPNKIKPTLRDKWPIRPVSMAGIKYYGEPSGEEFEQRVHVNPDEVEVGDICCYVKKKKIPKRIIKYIFFPCIIKTWNLKSDQALIKYFAESTCIWREAVVDKMWIYAATPNEVTTVKAHLKD